jgi:putative phosphoesterase
MRVAALYDIHGNVPALEAVLKDARESGVTHVVVGGDVVLGPMPRETLACMLTIGISVQFIQGNCDREVLTQMKGLGSAALPERIRQSVRWVAEQLDPEHERLLSSWPKTLSLQIPDLGEVLFCHATPRNDTEIFTRLTTESRLLPVFQGVKASLVVCGHTHMQFDRMIGSVRVVNAGSVGMPFGKPGADWLLLGPDIELRHTSYDLNKAADMIRDTKYPQAQEFATRNVLEAPAEDEILAAFAKAELS